MEILKEFIKLLTGNFDNKEQFEKFKEQNINDYPFAEHINNICNDKIKNLPENFEGFFLLEESYYTVNEKTRPLHHLFLFTQEGENVKLTSYEIPEEYSKQDFTFNNLKELDFNNLKISEKFTPAIYKKCGDIWEGGSESMFSPIMKFKLHEKFYGNTLEVSEIIEVNGKTTFGYDDPIIYKRKSIF